MKKVFNVINEGIERLEEMEADGLLKIGNCHLENAKGKPFLRNICMAFDAKLWRKTTRSAIVSTTC